MSFMFKFVGQLIGGYFTKTPYDYQDLSEEAKSLINDAFSDLPENFQITDFHTHLVGEGNGCCLHHSTQDGLNHPYMRTKYFAFLSASGVTDFSKVSSQYVERLVSLIRNAKLQQSTWGKHFLLAMDQRYNINGELETEKTGMYVPNDYVFDIANKYPDCFEPCISVHPYRKARCDAFYERMKSHKMVLLTHTGKEHSIDPPGLDNFLGNPLLLRRPLNKGLKIIAAHCASEGSSADIEDPDQPEVSNFRLLLRLFQDERYNKLLFADISAMTAFLRLGDPLTTMLDSQHLHSRLVFGSDYPVPAIKVTVITSMLVKGGYITSQERNLLNEIYQVNPLLFDFVTKRCLKSPVTGKRFSKELFGMHPTLFNYSE